MWKQPNRAVLLRKVKFPLIITVRPKFVPTNYPFTWTDLQTQLHLPHPWTRPTYHPKPHPYPTRRFSTIHWRDTHRQTDRPTDGWREWSITIGRLHYRERHGLQSNNLVIISFAINQIIIQHSVLSHNKCIFWLPSFVRNFPASSFYC